MQKKVLLSLLAAAPVAFTVSAHQNVSMNTLLSVSPGDHWNLGGISDLTYGENTVTVNQTGVKVFLDLAAEWKDKNGSDMPVGYYRIYFATFENCQMDINGTKYDNGATVEYTGGAFVITINDSEIASKMTFGGGELTLKYNFEDEQSYLQNEMAKLAITPLTTQNPGSQAYNDLVNENETLVKKMDALNSSIASLNVEGETSENYYLDIYETYKLWENPNVLRQALVQLTKEIEEFNVKAEAENLRYDNQVANEATLNGIMDKYNALEQKVNGIEEQINAGALYLQEACGEDLQALKYGLAALKNTIDSTFKDGDSIKDDSVIKPIEIEATLDTLDTLDGQADALADKLLDAENDVKAYNTWYTDRQVLYDAQENAIKTLNAAVEENEVFGKVLDQYTAEINYIVTTTTGNLKIKDEQYKGAANLLKEDQLTIADGINKISGVVNAFNEFVQTQNDAYQAANTATEAVQIALDAAQKTITDAITGENPTLNPGDVEKFNAEVKKIQGQINDMKDAIDAAYGKDLSADTYAEALADINSAIDKLNQDINTAKDKKALTDGNNGAVADLQGKLDALKTDVETSFKDTPLEKVFDSTIGNLQTSITEFKDLVDQLTADNKAVADDETASEAQKNILENLANIENVVKDVKNGWASAKVNIAEVQTALDAFQTAYDEKQVVISTAGEPLVDKAKILGDTITNFQDQIDALTNSFSKLTFDLKDYKNFQADFGNLVGQANAGENTMPAEIAKAQSEFLLAVSKANYEVANKAFQEMHEIYSRLPKDRDYPGKEAADSTVNTLNNTRAEINGALNPQEGQPTDADVNAQDSKCQELYNNSLDIEPTLQGLIDNIAAYDAIVAQYDATIDAITDAEEQIKIKTMQPAQDFFLNELKNIREKAEAEKAQADTDYQNIASKADEKGVMAKLISLETEAKNTVSKALLNEQAHLNQLELLENLQNLIAEVRYYIEENNKVETDKKIYLDNLDKCQADTDVAKSSIAEAFGLGTSDINNQDFEDAIHAIEDRVNAIKHANDKNYNTAVAGFNKDQLHNLKGGTPALTWDGWNNKLRETYRWAVTTYDEYNDNLSNKNYKEAIGNIITSHEGIYKYSTPIAQLVTKVRNAVQAMDESSTVITQKWLDENVFAPAQGIYDAIVNEVTIMEDTANAFAEQYYQTLNGEKLDLINNAKSTLVNAGVSTEIADATVAEANRIHTAAENYYNAGVAAGKLSVYMGKNEVTGDGVIVGGVANLLDQITSAAIDMAGAVKTQWSNDYNGATETLDGYYSNLTDKYTALSEEERAGFKAQLDEEKAQIDNLNKLFTEKDAEEQLAKLKTYQDALNEYLKAATGIDQDANDKNEYKVAENEAQQKFNGLLGDANDSLAALKAWVSGMAIEPNRDYTIIDNAIARAKKYIDSHVGALTDPEVSATVEALLSDIDMEIEMAYGTFYTDEIAALTELMNQAKRDFNEWAAGKDLTTDPYNTVNKKLDGLVDTLVGNAAEDIEGLQNQEIADFESKEAAREALLNLQKAFCDTMVEIAGYAGQPNPAEGVLGELNAEYDEVAAQIAALEQLLDTCDDDVKAKYGETISNAKTALDNVKDDYKADGNNIIATGDSFINEMKGISDSLNGLADSINADKTAHEASNAAAANLQTQLDELQSQLDAFKTFVDGCGMWEDDLYKPMLEDTYKPLLADLQNDLDKMQTWLYAQKEAYALNADSTLPDADQFTQNLNADIPLLAYTESSYQMGRANEAVKNASEIVHEMPHANQTDLEKKLADLQARLADLAPAGTIEGVAELTATVKAIIDDATALADEAVENSIITGDLDGDGEITSKDLNELVNLIAADTKYDDTNKVHKAANIAKSDDGNESLDIADAVALINMLMGDTPAQVRLKAAMNAPAQAPQTLIQAFEANEGGSRFVDVYLNNPVDFVGGQFDLILPEGMQIVSESLGERNDDMMLVTNDVTGTQHRVIFLSQELNSIDGNEGIVLHLEVIGGSGDVHVQNALFADSNANLYYGTDPGTTGIDGIFDSMKDGAQRVYDAAGRMLNKVQQGINIVVGRDGKANKIYRKR